MRLLLLAMLLALPGRLPAAEQIVILGDSLSKEYEFEFQLEGFQDPDSVRNWIEILDEERNAFFDMGSRQDINVLFFEVFFRHKFNWAVPGAKISQIADFLRGEIEFIDFFPTSDPTAFDAVISLIASFLTSDDFDLDDLDEQLRNKAERVVLFVGGNDFDDVYRELYNGDPDFDSAAWIASYVADAQFIVDWVLARNAGIEFVLVSVPHIGITPKVKSSHPTDPIKTARVTAALRDLNDGLATLARERGIGFADIFSTTLPLLDSAPLCIHGVPFLNELAPTSDPGDLDYVWMRGAASDGFHPNTNAQAQIANEILRAFNGHYAAGIPPLTATEILDGWLDKNPDVTFEQWLSCHGLSGAGINGDSDRDGLPAGLEFGVGADPTRFDPWQIQFSQGEEAGSPFVEIAYPLRLPGTAEVNVGAHSSANLSDWNPQGGSPTPGPDGLYRVRLPIGTGQGFLRLEANLP